MAGRTGCQQGIAGSHLNSTELRGYRFLHSKKLEYDCDLPATHGTTSPGKEGFPGSVSQELAIDSSATRSD